MKVKVVGSGSMWNQYNSASYLIDDLIAIDFPNGMCKNLFRLNINPQSIKNVVITHFHGDHYFDMPFFILLKSKSQDRNFNVYCGSIGKSKIYKLLELAFPGAYKEILSDKIIDFYDENSFLIDDYSFKRYLVSHGEMKPSYGYVIFGDNKNIGFTGDTSLCENVEIMADVCSYLFCDCMLLEGNTKHMGIDNIIYLADKYKNCKFVVSHLDNITRDKLNELKLENVIVPCDGDEILI